ncbi:MAG: OadG family transporter subunit [Acutalibacteraceae bacterium]
MFNNFDMSMSLGEKFLYALQVSLFGIVIVFALLIILAILIMIISRIVRAGESIASKKKKKTEAPAAPTQVQAQTAGTPLPDTLSQGSLVLEGVDEPTAAVIMAIVSDESGIPLNRLLFKSIKEKD